VVLCCVQVQLMLETDAFSSSGIVNDRIHIRIHEFTASLLSCECIVRTSSFC
jgi:hypothetical protein